MVADSEASDRPPSVLADSSFESRLPLKVMMTVSLNLCYLQPSQNRQSQLAIHFLLKMK